MSEYPIKSSKASIELTEKLVDVCNEYNDTVTPLQLADTLVTGAVHELLESMEPSMVTVSIIAMVKHALEVFASLGPTESEKLH